MIRECILNLQGKVKVTPLLEVKDLTTYFVTGDATVRAVDSLDFTLGEGETLALVGESGCGKSVTAYSIMRLVSPPGKIVKGEVLFGGTDLLRLPDEKMRHIRGNRISMVFQEPMSSLNPVFRVGEQIAEGLRLHRGLSPAEADEHAVELLRMVGIPAPQERLREYPHRLSGGMRQRVMIAMALACEPQLLIADEPTTALDVTIQAQILELLDRLKAERKMALLLITHDLGIVAERATSTAVMYAGKLIEHGPTEEIFRNPLHPYTEGLLASLPQQAEAGKKINTIPGSVPSLAGQLPGCGFCDRCPDKRWECRQEAPPLKEITAGHKVRCWKYGNI